jgi:hypothetical protein
VIAAARTHVPGRARLRAAATAAATLVAALAGVLIGGRVGADPATTAPAPPPEPAAQMLHAGVASLPVPDGWSVGAPRFAVPGVRSAAGMWGASDDAIFAVLPPEHASLLPAALVRRAGGAPEPRPTPGDVRGWRYEFTSPGDSGRMSLVVMPATSGVVTLACLSSGTADQRDECVDAARGVELHRGAWLAPGPDTAMRIALPAALERLNDDRRAGRRVLAAAGSPRERERAARSVARIYATAAALRPLAGDGRAGALVMLLARLEGDYRHLATAHAKRYRRLAVQAGAAIGRREARLERLIAAFSRSGGS